MRHSRPLISIEYVSKAYSDDFLNYEQLVLKNVSLTIQKGEFVIIFGPSGSGKSTLLNLLAGLERPTAGRVMVSSRDLTRFNDVELAKYHRRKMGMVFQSFNLVKSLNVWENVALPQTADGVPYATRLRRAKHMLKLFGLEDYLYRHPNELSGGEQQRVAISRALINNPLLLLIDEPTGNLDSKSADDVMNIFAGLHQKSKHTIILVTHNPDYLHYASRVIYVQDGEIKRQEYNQAEPTPHGKALPDEHFDALGQYKSDPDDAEHGAADGSGKAKDKTAEPAGPVLFHPKAEIKADGSVAVSQEPVGASADQPAAPVGQPEVQPASEPTSKPAPASAPVLFHPGQPQEQAVAQTQPLTQLQSQPQPQFQPQSQPQAQGGNS